MFKICTIGCGGIALDFHGPGIRKYIAESPGDAAWSCCDIDMGRAKAFAAKFGLANCYSDYREMLETERPDAVCIFTSYDVIPAIAVDVISMGFPVMLEKPPGVNRGEVMAIVEAARKHNMPTQVAFNRRLTPVVNELKHMLQGLDGSTSNIRCVFQRIGRKNADFYTTAIHGIDTVRYLAGSDYKHVRFRYQELTDGSRGAANFYLDCVMESGATACLSFSPQGGKVIEDYYVSCRDNEFTLKMPVWGSPEYPGGLWHFSGNECVRFLDGGSPCYGDEMYEKFGFYAENASFFDNIKAGVMPVNDIASALQSVEIADCIWNRKDEFTATPSSSA